MAPLSPTTCFYTLLVMSWRVLTLAHIGTSVAHVSRVHAKAALFSASSQLFHLNLFEGRGREKKKTCPPHVSRQSARGLVERGSGKRDQYCKATFGSSHPLNDWFQPKRTNHQFLDLRSKRGTFRMED